MSEVHVVIRSNADAHSMEPELLVRRLTSAHLQIFSVALFAPLLTRQAQRRRRLLMVKGAPGLCFVLPGLLTSVDVHLRTQRAPLVTVRRRSALAASAVPPPNGSTSTPSAPKPPEEKPLRLSALQRFLISRLRRSIAGATPGNVSNVFREVVDRARGAPPKPPVYDDEDLESVLLPETDEKPYVSPALRRLLRGSPAESVKTVYTRDPSRTLWEQLLLWGGIVLVALAVLRVLWLFLSAILGISLSLIVIVAVTAFIFLAFVILRQ
ncbi:hypothetical protein F1559_000037 [Cyanidiococcus yangmingshanensis]|uniref:Uncharacterized protein n=1 Tax=Cyanidiococcus yangmingshanensis TaxID=2690220 RepID=A0A7J7IBZ1_9RHOD|nr:hypothetical protein F1559_000037 [Cyanidiococcus yangmingshanensis]